MRDDDKRRRRRRDKARRRERLAAKHHDPATGLGRRTDAELKMMWELYQAAPAANTRPAFTDDDDDSPTFLDFSPAVVEHVPLTQVRDLLWEELAPRMRAKLKDDTKRSRRLVKDCRMETVTALLVPRQGQAVSGCMVALLKCPDCRKAELVACTLAELHDPALAWRPDLRDFLRAQATDLQARADDGGLEGGT
jgi:hypothetical protein